jgi:septin family protein
MKLTILRGPSGTGKTTIAKAIGGLFFEADMYFSLGREYSFDPAKLGAAHKWCQESVANAMAGNRDVIVSNTSTSMWEMKPYLAMAVMFDAELEIIRTPGPWDAEVLANRNSHNVPLNTIKKQISRYVEHESEKEWTDMSIFNE